MYSLSFQSWDEFFSRATQGAPPGQAYDAPPTLRPGGVTEDPNLIRDHLAVQALIRAYQIRGRDTFGGGGGTHFWAGDLIRGDIILISGGSLYASD